MGATGVAFLSTEDGQIRPRPDIREVPIRVFFSDKKGKPVRPKRYEIRRTSRGVGSGNTCLIPAECWSGRLDGRLCFRHLERKEEMGETSGGRGAARHGVDLVGFKAFSADRAPVTLYVRLIPRDVDKNSSHCVANLGTE